MVQKYKLSDLKDAIQESYNLFICSASFETRCLSIAKSINKKAIQRAMIIYNSECLSYIGANKESLLNIFTDKSNSVEFKQSDPIFSADNVIISLTELNKKDDILSILLDITTFTHEMLLILLRIFPIVCPNAEITCIYANASEYHPNAYVPNGEDNENDAANKKWLSKGVVEIRSVLGYSGNILPLQKTHLIVIVGYEHERAASIIKALEPNSLALGYGRPDNATTEKDKEANEQYLELTRQMAVSYDHIDTFDITCDDPFKTFEKISEMVSSQEGKNVLIVPLNNKISTIGVAFTAIKDSNIQLCYAPALIYNYTDYSTPGSNCYVFKISQFIRSMGEQK
ncbi:MAG: hypothetical protein LBR10_04405 [Prevotellaceae bacterium]|jgi:hypothetical protein|nr:hypothetical protein [Prevotellaceae bacterium]